MPPSRLVHVCVSTEAACWSVSRCIRAPAACDPPPPQTWVSGKVEQLLGVKEPTLVDYVVKLLAQGTSAAALAIELSPVLDSDTETFVIKLYRTVIYETEKALMGL